MDELIKKSWTQLTKEEQKGLEVFDITSKNWEEESDKRQEILNLIVTQGISDLYQPIPAQQEALKNLKLIDDEVLTISEVECNKRIQAKEEYFDVKLNKIKKVTDEKIKDDQIRINETEKKIEEDKQELRLTQISIDKKTRKIKDLIDKNRDQNEKLKTKEIIGNDITNALTKVSIVNDIVNNEKNHKSFDSLQIIPSGHLSMLKSATFISLNAILGILVAMRIQSIMNTVSSVGDVISALQLDQITSIIVGELIGKNLEPIWNNLKEETLSFSDDFSNDLNDIINNVNGILTENIDDYSDIPSDTVSEIINLSEKFSEENSMFDFGESFLTNFNILDRINGNNEIIDEMSDVLPDTEFMGEFMGESIGEYIGESAGEKFMKVLIPTGVFLETLFLTLTNPFLLSALAVVIVGAVLSKNKIKSSRKLRHLKGFPDVNVFYELNNLMELCFKLKIDCKFDINDILLTPENEKDNIMRVINKACIEMKNKIINEWNRTVDIENIKYINAEKEGYFDDIF